MKKIADVMEKAYTVITFIALGVGFIVAVLFIISLIIAGNTGESLAVMAGDIMMWAIRLASIAILLGVIKIYLSNTHSLTMDGGGEQEEQ